MALDGNKAIMSSAKDAAVAPQAPLVSASPRALASASPPSGHSEANSSVNSVATTSAPSAAHQLSPTSFSAQKTTPHGGSSTRKRVFTFQKRWLHSLPIMEKTLPEPIDGGAMVIKKSALRGAHANGASAATAPATADSTSSSLPPSPSGESAHDVIVCMLCDEQNSNHHLMKIWSRVNCRRGRIENHLMSKHPEFMLLLKHKRDSEGELAVQIFLQGMRDGRCNIRSEISLGLYNHIQSLNTQAAHASMDLVSEASVAAMTGIGLAAVDAAHHSDLFQLHNQTNSKRGFPSASVYATREGLMGGAKQLPAGATRVALELLEVENRHKRAKLMAASEATTEAFVAASPDTAAKAATFAGLQTTTVAGHTLDPLVFAQRHPVLVNKLVVVTGGESERATAIATHLWLLGANVLLTFTDIAALDAFTTSHITRFPDIVENGSADPPRGVMLSMLCSFQTRKQIDEWSRSIADKFTRVNFLINFVYDIDANSSDSSADNETGSTKALRLHEGADAPNTAANEAEENTSLGENGSVSNANQLRALCRSIYAACLQSAGSGSVLNIAIQSDKSVRDLSCTAVEAMTKSLALELQASNVQLNSILVQQQPLHSSSAPNAQLHLVVQQDEQQHAVLLHSILFLLSPMSASISGSILRLQCRAKGDSIHAPASVGISAPSTAAAESGVAATLVESSAILSSGNAATALSRPAANHIV